MKKQVIFLFLFYLAVGANSQQFTGKVIDVIDGNTFDIMDENENIIRYMLSAVDCPELGQPMSKEAKAYAEKLLHKKTVTVERRGKDWLGNRLATITLKNGKLLHEELLHKGYAWASRKASPEITNLQSVAENNKVGIWSIEEQTPPWIYRRQQTMMTAKGR